MIAKCPTCNYSKYKCPQCGNCVYCNGHCFHPTPQERSTCCDLCRGLEQNPHRQLEFCISQQCPCHQPSPADTKVEDWAAEFIATFYVYNLKKDTPAGAEKEAVAFIKNLIEKVRQEANDNRHLDICSFRGEGSGCECDAYKMGEKNGIRAERERILAALPQISGHQVDIEWVRSIIINPTSHPSV